MPSLNKKKALGTPCPAEYECDILVIKHKQIGMSITVKYKKRKETPQQNTTTTNPSATTPSTSTVNPAISTVAESVITACFLGTKERLLVP